MKFYSLIVWLHWCSVKQNKMKTNKQTTKPQTYKTTTTTTKTKAKTKTCLWPKQTYSIKKRCSHAAWEVTVEEFTPPPLEALLSLKCPLLSEERDGKNQSFLALKKMTSQEHTFLWYPQSGAITALFFDQNLYIIKISIDA